MQLGWLNLAKPFCLKPSKGRCETARSGQSLLLPKWQNPRPILVRSDRVRLQNLNFIQTHLDLDFGWMWHNVAELILMHGSILLFFALSLLSWQHNNTFLWLLACTASKPPSKRSGRSPRPNRESLGTTKSLMMSDAVIIRNEATTTKHWHSQRNYNQVVLGRCHFAKRNLEIFIKKCVNQVNCVSSGHLSKIFIGHVSQRAFLVQYCVAAGTRCQSAKVSHMQGKRGPGWWI